MTDNSFANDNGNQTEQNEPNTDDNQIGLTAEDIAKIRKRLDDSQDFIDTLKNERRSDREEIERLRQQLEQSTRVDEALNRFRELDEEDRTPEQTAPRVDEDELLSKLEERVFNKLSVAEREQLENNNWEESVNMLKSKFGDNYISQVQERAKELGMPVSEMDRLAKTSPKAFSDLVFGQQRGSTKPTTSSTNSAAFSGRGDDEAEYFAKINRLRFGSGPEAAQARKTYKSPEFQAAWRRHILESNSNS